MVLELPDRQVVFAITTDHSILPFAFQVTSPEGLVDGS
jgi:hypothetical protein